MNGESECGKNVHEFVAYFSTEHEFFHKRAQGSRASGRCEALISIRICGHKQEKIQKKNQQQKQKLGWKKQKKKEKET